MAFIFLNVPFFPAQLVLDPRPWRQRPPALLRPDAAEAGPGGALRGGAADGGDALGGGGVDGRGEDGGGRGE